MTDTLEDRIEDLEKIVAQTGLGYGQYFPGSLRICRADKDNDGDFDPYTSTAWDGDSFSTGVGTIDWNADFGVPDSAKMVCLSVSVRDSSAADGSYGIAFKAKSTSARWSFQSKIYIPNNEWSQTQGWAMVAQDGTSYYTVMASGTSTCDIYIDVVAYAR